MPSTYTPNLGIEKPATGEQAGVWGKTVNTSYDSLDKAIDGSVVVKMSASSYSLLTNVGVTSEGHNKIIVFQETLPSDGTVIIQPNTAQKIYFVANHTDGGHALIFQAQSSSGATFRLENGRSAVIFCDGLGVSANVRGVLNDLQLGSLVVTGPLTVGGTVTYSGSSVFNAPVSFNALVTATAGLTASNPITLFLGGDANYDMYYRSASGTMTRLGYGSPGAFLQTNGNGGPPTWVTISIGIGTVLAGASAWSALFTNAGGAISQDVNFRYNGIGLGIGNPSPQTMLHLGSGAVSSSLWFDGPAQSPRGLSWMTATQFRWSIQMSSEPEAGGASGCNFRLSAFRDDGNFLSSPINLFRNTGNMTIGEYGDYSAQLAVRNQRNQPSMRVYAVGGQTANLQEWWGPSNTLVAYVDPAGNYVGGTGGSYVPLTSGRIDLYGSIPGHPAATIHVGKNDPTGNGAGSIILEQAPSAPSWPDSTDVTGVRLYMRSGKFVIQYRKSGAVCTASLDLSNSAGGTATWFYGSTI